MSSGGVIVTQLVVDASGATKGVAEYEAAMDRARDAQEAAGASVNSFDSALKKWVNSLGAADPVIRAQINQQQALNRQMAINADAVKLGIATQAAAETQLEKVRQKYGAYVTAAEEAKNSTTGMGVATSKLTELVGPLLGLLSAGALLDFAKARFEDAAALNDAAQQAGTAVEAYQAYVAVMQQSGISADSASTFIARLTHDIGLAMNAAGPARDAFNQLGVTVSDLAGGFDAVMPKVAASLLSIPDAATRARLEVELFSKSGQQLESALQEMIGPTSDLIDKQKALGQVLGEDVTTAAKKANDEWDVMAKRVKTQVTPAIVEAVTAFLDFQKAVNNSDIVKNGIFGGGPVQAMAQAAAAQAAAEAERVRQQRADEASGKASFGFAINNPVFLGGANDGRPVGTAARYSTAETDKFVANAKMAADMAGLSAQRRAEETATIGRANAELADGAKILVNNDGTLRKTVNSYDEARGLIGDAAAKQVEQLAAITYQGQQADKLKETFGQYLDQLDQATIAAGQSTAQQQAQAEVIKGAQVYQKQNNVLAKDLAKNYDDAAAALGPVRTQLLLNKAAAEQTAAFDKSMADEQTVANAALAAGVDQRDLAVQIAEKQLQLGRELTDVEKERLKTIQATNDAVNLDRYISGLKDELTITGATADERERQQAILQAIHATHGNLNADQAKEIDGLIQIRQEMDKWQQLVGDIQSDFANFFDDILEHGSLNFGKLIRSIESSFAQMLAQMAAQAIAQPIIIPMIQEVVGSLGGSGASGLLSSLGGGGSGGISGLLSNGGSLLGGLGGAGGLLGGIGGALGFATPGIALAPVTTTLTGIGSSLGPVSLGASGQSLVSGSLFGGTTLGGFMGGIGLGSLASSLVFGNKNDASTGSMIGAGIGTLIAGPLGGLAGGLIGGGLGSLTGSGNHGAWVDLSNGGANYAITQQGSAGNTDAVSQVAKAYTDAVAQLKAAGLDVTNNVKSLMIGSNKDVIQYTDGRSVNLSANNPDELLKTAMSGLLSSITSTDADMQKVIAAYQNKGGINSSNIDQFLSDIGFAGKLKNTDFNPAPLTQSEQLLKSINDQFQTAIDHATQLGLDTTSLISARDKAIQEVIGDFNDAAAASLSQLTNPIQAAYDVLVKSQSDRLKEATALGADLAKLDNLSQAELEQFLLSLTDAQRKALSAANDIAQTVGYQLAEGMGDLASQIDDLVSQAGTAANAAKAAANDWASAADDLTKASKALLISDQSLSPFDAYKNASAQFDQLKNAALGGDVNAASQLSSFASQFLQTSYSYNASSPTYANDLAMVQATLAQVASFSSTQQTLAQQQADAALAAIPLLQTIADTLKTQMLTSKQQLDDLKSQVATLAATIKQSNSINLMTQSNSAAA